MDRTDCPRKTVRHDKPQFISTMADAESPEPHLRADTTSPGLYGLDPAELNARGLDPAILTPELNRSETDHRYQEAGEIKTEAEVIRTTPLANAFTLRRDRVRKDRPAMILSAVAVVAIIAGNINYAAAPNAPASAPQVTADSQTKPHNLEEALRLYRWSWDNPQSNYYATGQFRPDGTLFQVTKDNVEVTRHWKNRAQKRACGLCQWPLCRRDIQ